MNILLLLAFLIFDIPYVKLCIYCCIAVFGSALASTMILFLLFTRDDALQNFPHSPLHVYMQLYPHGHISFFSPFCSFKFINHWLGNLPKWVVEKIKIKRKRGKYITEERGRPENSQHTKKEKVFTILVSTRLLTTFNQLRTQERSHKPFHFISR